MLETYAGLFGDSGGGGAFEQKWGWYISIHQLAGENYLRMDEVVATPVEKAFSHLAFLNDLNRKRKHDYLQQHRK